MPKLMRERNGVIFEDKRKYYSFTTVNGKIVETKSMSREEAKRHIESCLGSKLKEAA